MSVPILTTLIGIALILLTLFDVFVTVLHPQAESPISSKWQMFVWMLIRRTGRALKGKARHRLLGLGVPLIIILQIAAWISLLLLGFAIIYASWMNNPEAFHSPNPNIQATWVDALYFSGVTLGTIGYGDFQPIHPFLRIVSVLEGLSGMAVTAMGIAYVLEIYPAMQRQRVLAVMLNEETSGQVDALPMIERYLRNDNFEALADSIKTINRELLYLAEAHRRLPVLHHSHPPEVERSFLRIMLVVVNLVGTLRYGMASANGRKWSEDPRVQNLEDSLFYTLHTLGTSTHLPIISAADQQQHIKELDGLFRALIKKVKNLGFPTPDTQVKGSHGESQYQRARKGFLSLRLTSDILIVSYLRNSGYTYAEAVDDAVRPQRQVVELEAELEAEAKAHPDPGDKDEPHTMLEASLYRDK